MSGIGAWRCLHMCVPTCTCRIAEFQYLSIIIALWKYLHIGFNVGLYNNYSRIIKSTC